MSAEDRAASPMRAQNIILESRKRLHISGVEEIARFDDTFVVMKTFLGELRVSGEALHVDALNTETGDLSITGSISELIYSESAERVGFWSRLFG